MNLAKKAFQIGLIGTGRISDIYLENCLKFPELNIAACGSLDQEEAEKKAKKYGIKRICLPEEIICDKSIDCILNLTVPAAHAEISRKSLMAGKHVYSEKPFATSVSDGEEILKLAKEKNLKVGNAPDTFLGGRWQTVRKILDDGIIGKPVGVMAYVGTHGVERHNPNPDFYYKKGGGPLLDLGPYYLTAMVSLLGPIKRVSGMASRSFSHREIENGPRYGELIAVEVETHSVSTLEFSNGILGSMTMSFDIWDSDTPRFEIYGEAGTICIPDPDPVHGANVFQGPVYYRTRADSRWEFQPRPKGRENWNVANNLHGFNEDSRGLGLLDLAYSIQEDRPVRPSGELAHHVLEVMCGIQESSKRNISVSIQSSCIRPAPLPISFPKKAKGIEEELQNVS